VQGREGKVVQVYRKKWVIHIERITREKVNGERLPGCRGGERLSCGRSCACLCASSHNVHRAAPADG